jgi:glycosyltransferase involved in cell wall biosynthesis
MRPTNQTRAQHNSASRRHFCIVTETYPPEVNGVASTLGHWVDGLRSQGYIVSIVRPRQESFDSAHVRFDPRVTLVPGLPLPGYRDLRFGWPSGGMLGRRWTEHPPDVVYVATEGPLGWSAVRTARRLGIPIVSGFHTNFHSYCSHYHVRWLRPLIFRYLCHFHSQTAGTLVPSADLRTRLQSMGLRNVSVVGRGVDSELFSPQRRSARLRHIWHASDDDLVLLYVGRVAGEKNLELAVEAYRAIKQRSTRAVKFVIVGDGPLRAALQSKHPGLVFCGVQTGKKLAEHYASADVFLFPSETETFGNVTLEAMASGLAVVAYDYAAAHMHIIDGESGVLVPCGDSSAFVDRAVTLAGAPQALARMRRQARQYAISWHWKAVVERFARILMSPLDNDQSGSIDVASEPIEVAPLEA